MHCDESVPRDGTSHTKCVKASMTTKNDQPSNGPNGSACHVWSGNAGTDGLLVPESRWLTADRVLLIWQSVHERR